MRVQYVTDVGIQASVNFEFETNTSGADFPSYSDHELSRVRGAWEFLGRTMLSLLCHCHAPRL
jgi:hypothetical protein